VASSPSKTIEPKPTKMGGGPSASHASSALHSSVLSSTFCCVAGLQLPTTLTSDGQSRGLGTKAGDQSLAKGTLRAATSAEPAPPRGSEGRESDRRNEGMKPGACSTASTTA